MLYEEKIKKLTLRIHGYNVTVPYLYVWEYLVAQVDMTLHKF